MTLKTEPIWRIFEEFTARLLGIDPKILRKHFAEEFEVGHAEI
jgi:hypothetical protein